MKPDFNTIQCLYEVECLTTRQIGSQFGVSKTEVLRWLKFYNIPRRAAGRGLAYRGETEPTREDLIDFIQVQHLSFRDIASKYNVDPTAVSYWLDKYDLPHPTVWDTRRKGEHPVLPTREELEQMYSIDGMPLVNIGEHYDVSANTISRLCKKYGITVNLDGFDGGKRYECKDGHLVRSVYEQQVDDWLYDRGIAHSYDPRLPFDNRSKSDFLANGWYIEVWGVTQNKEYTERRKRKVQGYKDHNLPLIELEVHYFNKEQNQLWARRLKKVLEPPVTPLQLF